MLYHLWKIAIIRSNHPWLLGISVYAYLMFHHKGSSYYCGLTLMPACISSRIPSKVWGEIIYLYPNFNGANISHLTLSWACDYLCMLGLKLNHVNKRGPISLYGKQCYENWLPPPPPPEKWPPFWQTTFSKFLVWKWYISDSNVTDN